MPGRFLYMLWMVCVLSGWTAAPAVAQPGAPRFDLDVKRVDRDGDKAYRIASSAEVAAAPAAVWQLLTDYERLPEYLPNLKRARIVSRQGDRVVLEQLGNAHFLFFSQTIRLLVQVDERPPDHIDVSLIEGDMKVYVASWQLSPIAGEAGTRLTYHATIVPKFPVPAILGTNMIRKDVGKMMEAVLVRLDRPEPGVEPSSAPLQVKAR